MKISDSLLVLGALTGMLLALVGLVEADRQPLGGATAALVNDIPISSDELQSTLQRRAQQGAPASQLGHILDDMITEELLIQRAAELGILRRDSVVRMAIVQAMEKSILSEVHGQSLSDSDIETFYRENAARFAEPLRLQVEELVVTDMRYVSTVKEKLQEGISVEAITTTHKDVSLTRMPLVPVSLDTLARRIPRTLFTRSTDASSGDVFVYESSRGTHFLRVVQREDARLPPLDEIRISVLNELQLQRQDEAYEKYLLWLRQRADIRINKSMAG